MLFFKQYFNLGFWSNIVLFYSSYGSVYMAMSLIIIADYQYYYLYWLPSVIMLSIFMSVISKRNLLMFIWFYPVFLVGFKCCLLKRDWKIELFRLKWAIHSFLHKHINKIAFNLADVSHHIQSSIIIAYNSEHTRCRKSIKFEFRLDNSQHFYNRYIVFAYLDLLTGYLRYEASNLNESYCSCIPNCLKIVVMM